MKSGGQTDATFFFSTAHNTHTQTHARLFVVSLFLSLTKIHNTVAGTNFFLASFLSHSLSRLHTFASCLLALLRDPSSCVCVQRFFVVVVVCLLRCWLVLLLAGASLAVETPLLYFGSERKRPAMEPSSTILSDEEFARQLQALDNGLRRRANSSSLKRNSTSLDDATTTTTRNSGTRLGSVCLCCLCISVYVYEGAQSVAVEHLFVGNVMMKFSYFRVVCERQSNHDGGGFLQLVESLPTTHSDCFFPFCLSLVCCSAFQTLDVIGSVAVEKKKTLRSSAPSFLP